MKVKDNQLLLLKSFQYVCVLFSEILMDLLSIGLIILFVKWKS